MVVFLNFLKILVLLTLILFQWSTTGQCMDLIESVKTNRKTGPIQSVGTEPTLTIERIRNEGKHSGGKDSRHPVIENLMEPLQKEKEHWAIVEQSISKIPQLREGSTIQARDKLMGSSDGNQRLINLINEEFGTLHRNIKNFRRVILQPQNKFSRKLETIYEKIVLSVENEVRFLGGDELCISLPDPKAEGHPIKSEIFEDSDSNPMEPDFVKVFDSKDD
ncbi:hypothetical protein PGT21_031380 [Puccinia graminis f. sp. tritici]|uniref:Uncharacterized protein n=1 Tax=Puccinia graminis f. sp. tritici TaxID=56615 RepID=A0A5B0MQC5_PUCGR|nr:hypothetical protein PGT21_031380 [Puccinia graminis f. sp. tritici]